jgi:transcriptional regulator GlxA family with amidase domain
MQIAVLTFDGFNELDSFIAYGMLNRMKSKGWKAFITSPSSRIASMNGVVVEAERQLEFANIADAVIFGSGVKTREIAQDRSVLDRLNLDPQRQLIAAQCSGTLLLAKLGLLGDRPACTDLVTKPWVIEAGVTVLNQPFFADGNIATAGGCLASHYLATWFLLRGASKQDAENILHHVAPVGEKADYVARAFKAVEPYVVAPPVRELIEES